MFDELNEDTDKKLIELRKTMQDMNSHFYKELEIMKKNKAEILDRKHSVENMSSRNNQSEGRPNLKTRLI